MSEGESSKAVPQEPAPAVTIVATSEPGGEASTTAKPAPQTTTKPAESQLEPLPEYTKAWGPNLYRPKKMPEHYDTRIDPAHIFVFTVHPITGIERDFYVTPKPCDYCAKVRQICSRTRPHCQRCGLHPESTRACVVEEGWVRLPGPKCKKPKRKREREAAAGGNDAKKAKKSAANPSAKGHTAANGHGKNEAKSPPHSEASNLSEKSTTPNVTRDKPARPPAKSRAPVNRTRSISTDTPNEAVPEPNGMIAPGHPTEEGVTSAPLPSPARTSSRYGFRPHIRHTAKAA